MNRRYADMMIPVRCAHCGTVYDLTKVEVTARYTDCSMWKCPGCKRTVDDRGETGWKSTKDYHRITAEEPEFEVDVYGRFRFHRRQR